MRKPKQNSKNPKTLVPLLPSQLMEYCLDLYGRLHEIDIKVTQIIYSFTQQYTILRIFSKVIGFISNGPALPLFLLLYGILNKPSPVSFMAFTIFCVLFHELTIKAFFHRKRPNTSGDTKGLSFPSSHSFASGFIIVTTLAMSFPYSIAIVTFSLVNALNRLSLGVHYFVDVIVGLALGLMAGGIWIYIIQGIATVALP